jgi:hypothetical protein
MASVEYDFDLVKSEVLKKFRGAPEGVAGAVILMTVKVLEDLYGIEFVEKNDKIFI